MVPVAAPDGLPVLGYQFEEDVGETSPNPVGVLGQVGVPSLRLVQHQYDLEDLHTKLAK
jgi:hypothetical protein